MFAILGFMLQVLSLCGAFNVLINVMIKRLCPMLCYGLFQCYALWFVLAFKGQNVCIRGLVLE